MRALVTRLSLALVLGACSPGSSLSQSDRPTPTFPSDAFDEDPVPEPLSSTPSTSRPAPPAEPASVCPGATTCRLFIAGDALSTKDGTVTVEYRVNPDGRTNSGLSSTEVVAAIRAAAEAWSNADDRIVFRYRGPTTAPAGTAGVVAFGQPCAHGSYPACTDRRTEQPSITFSAVAPWMWEACGGNGNACDPYPQTCEAASGAETCQGIDLQAVATHEWGHVLGLEDLTTAQADGLTMYARATVADEQGARVLRGLSTLGLGDVVGLRSLYPGRSKSYEIRTP